MHNHLLSTTEDLAVYDRFIRNHPLGSLWQSLEWKRFQEALGREARIYALMEETQILASALVTIDRTAFGFSTWDIPRGPLAVSSQQYAASDLLETIVREARQEKCLSIYLSPETPCVLRAAYCVLRPSSRHEQPAATRIIDLTLTEEDILRQMKPKGRYNISVAEKNGVRVVESQDIPAFMGLLKQTGLRDNFSFHSARHYEAFLRELTGSFLFLAFAASPPNPLSDPTQHQPERGRTFSASIHVSERQGAPPSPEASGVVKERGGWGGEAKPVAGLLGVIWGSKAYYYYGASDYAHRALMAPYALQWAAMRHARAAGCTTYDLLGVSPPDAPANHLWQGVSVFKEKFGGSVEIYPPEQEIVLRPVTKTLLQWKRSLLG
ncbi:MAG: peptidoglycan bridge formation glycyltransferase FemA/FemB family protein [Candidatus Peribacteraceae bacterium]|nr:peptidoglycan bridge formation glycyltransferase FemA/FemB family protein [Candidatus Peribacteraceae bacterium]MDD5742573.1 peptidoglycan bridge formation glycyltransferase FemA/FemB family protein [Candidatus Peribacteraceae bacterium]